MLYDYHTNLVWIADAKCAFVYNHHFDEYEIWVSSVDNSLDFEELPKYLTFLWLRTATY